MRNIQQEDSQTFYMNQINNPYKGKVLNFWSIFYIFELTMLVSSSCFGQFSSKYKKYSADKSHYIISEPYSNQEYDTLGNTTIYNNKGKIKWRIERYFVGESTFISENGSTLTFVTPFNDAYSAPISIYNRNGFLKKYQIKDLVDLEKSYAKLSWIHESVYKGGVKDTISLHGQEIIHINSYDPNSLEKFIDKNQLFSNDDNLYITTCEGKIFQLDLNSGVLKNFSDNCYEWFSSQVLVFDSLKMEKYETNFGRGFGIPELESGQEFDASLAEYLNFKNISNSDLGYVKIKKGVKVNLSLLIDRSGTPEIVNIEMDDEILKKKIKNYILKLKFTTKFNPINVEKAYYFDIIFMDMESN